MARLALVAVDQPGLAPLPISPRLRSQLNYFMTPADAPGLPALGEAEFWIAAEEVARWLDEGVIALVSPLDTANMTEVELSEEQETLLQWLHDHDVQHVRVVG
ncbi:MAG TPA: hypothetical protein VF590_23535 [Isosphaeraceae bacterium]